MSQKSMKILKTDLEMDQEDIFSSLPPEIILNILSRIPIKTVFACKCVCKPWLHLLKTPEFARSHLSKSVPGLFVHCSAYYPKSDKFKIFEFEDSLAIEPHELRYKTVLELGLKKHFNLSCGPGTYIEGSANGLLFFSKTSYHYVCNPITRECIKLPEPEGMIHETGTVLTYGFGVSRLSNLYKVVRIFRDCVPDPDEGSFIAKSFCQVFTLGTGSWRRVAPPCETLLDYGSYAISKFLNGNIYWLALDSKGIWWISCLDLETEVFTKFQAPTVESGHYDLGSGLAIGVLRNRLCVTDCSSESEIIMYLMNGYGDENKSWNKEYVISKGPDFDAATYCFVYPVKDFAGGDMLMASMHIPLIYYSNKTKTLELVGTLDADVHFAETILYTPSLISLKDF